MKPLWIRKLDQQSAQSHVVLICVCFMLVSMLIQGIYMAGVMYSKSYEETNARMQPFTQKSVENLEQSFSFISNTAMAVATTQTVLQWIDNPSILRPESKEYYSTISTLRDEIKHILAYSSAWKNNYISYIAFFVNDELVLYTYTKPISEAAIVTSATRAYAKALNRESPQVVNIQPFADENRLFHLRVMKHNYASNESAAILVATDEIELRSQYNQSLDESVMQTYLIDQAGFVFSTSDPSMLGKACHPSIIGAVERQEHVLSLEGEQYVCSYQSVANTQFTFVNLIPYDTIVAQAWAGMPVFIMIALLLCLALLVTGYFVSLKSTAFIHELAQGMAQIQAQNYDVKMKQYRNGAINMLGNAFNSMTASMKTLLKDTYEAKIMKQEMQLEFLQQQINPHFLFNILLTIQIKAKLNGDDTVYDMLTSLSGFLRASIYDSKNTYTVLGEEMRCVRYYLFLQQQRFESKLEYEIDIPEDLENWVIPRLTLEPIVENAIVHGMEVWNRPVKISVIASVEEACLVVCISDNGSGFDVSKLDLSDISDKDLADLSNITRDKIGLRNTNNRLKLLYGDEYALSIQSCEGFGTCITLRIPKKQEGK